MADVHLTQEVANRLSAKMLNEVFCYTYDYHPEGFYIDFNEFPELDTDQKKWEMANHLMTAYNMTVFFGNLDKEEYEMDEGEGSFPPQDEDGNFIVEVEHFDNAADAEDSIRDEGFDQDDNFYYFCEYNFEENRFEFSPNTGGPLDTDDPCDDSGMFKMVF